MLHRLQLLETLDQSDALPHEAAAAKNIEELRAQLEAENEKLYRAARSEIAQQRSASILRSWLDAFRPLETNPSVYRLDRMDDILCGILQEPHPQHFDDLGSELVPFQPTPVRHTLDMITGSGLSSDDVLIDLGSGLGRVPILANILTGCRAIGVEIQRNLATSATHVASQLCLDRVAFRASDVRTTDLTEGTVFYLFTPFTGTVLDDVLQRLRSAAELRAITLCALGPCTEVVRSQPWLCMDPPIVTQIRIFRSTALR